MSAKAIPLARAVVLAPFIRFLEEAGVPYDRLLEEARLSPDLLSRPDALFPLHQGMHFLDRAARREGIPHFGLLVGQRTRLADLGELSRLLSSSMTLCGAIIMLAQVIRLFNSAERLSLHRQGMDAIFCHTFTCDELTGQSHGDLFTLSVMIDVIRLAAGPRWRPGAIRLPTTEASWRDAYASVFRAPIACAGNTRAIVFKAALLAEPLCYCTAGAPSSVDALATLQASAPADDLRGSLQQVLASLLPRGNPPIGVAAEVAGLSIRTLQRRLAETGTSYSHLVEETRLRLARQMMRDADIKLVDVALELGYSDAANFTRAFRRWTGVSPQQVRRTAIGLPAGGG